MGRGTGTPPRRGLTSSSASACALVLALAATSCDAHMSVVCSSTSPSNPGAFTFWVGTYHPNPGSNMPGSGIIGAVQGEIHIREPDNTEPSAAFSRWCSLQNCATLPCAVTDPGIPGPSTIEEVRAEMELAGHCTAVVDDNMNKLMYDDSVLSCYEANPGMDPERYGSAVTSGTGTNTPGANERLSINCNGLANTQSAGSYEFNVPVHMRDLRTMYGVVVPGVKAGTYKTWTVGTDDNLDPSPKIAGTTPCGMTEAAPFYFDIAVADGKRDCVTPPPVKPNSNAGSMQFCAPAQGRRIFSGFVCSVTCQAGFTRVGTMQCFDGEWTPYACTDKPTCAPPGQVPGNDVAIPGKNSTIVAVWDGEPGPPVEPGCGELTIAGTACNYTCASDVSPFCSPTRTTPSGAKKLNFPLRGEIVCGADAKWHPGNNFCGCRGFPCSTPTPTLSLTPTSSLTITMTPSITITTSLTISLTITPTITKTNVPLCLLLEPYASLFCDESDIIPWLPWLLLLLLCCMLCCLLIAMLAKKQLPPDEPPLEPDPPAAVPGEDIEVNVKPVPAPPTPPPAEVIDITLMKVPVPPEPGVEVGVHPVPAPSGVQIGVHSIPKPDNDITIQGTRLPDEPTATADVMTLV